MVILPHRLTELIEKGEVTERYYNPGDLFEEVHLVFTVNDHPDPEKVQKMVGNAKLHIYNVEPKSRFFIRTMGFWPLLMKKWARDVVSLAEKIQPQLIRCHGAGINAYAASEIKNKLGIPFAISLHINPDEDVRGRSMSFKQRLYSKGEHRLEIHNLHKANIVLPVYKPIVSFLNRIGVEAFEVCYNVLNPSNLRKKDDYALSSPVKIISVGRQIEEKKPDNLIRAVAAIPNASITLVGDGPVHEYLKNVAYNECKLGDRAKFIPAISNDELCKILPNFDVFATHTEYWEISKSVLEPLLTGLPIILNRRIGEQVPELTDDLCYYVENDIKGYQDALEKMIARDDLREELGRTAYIFAQNNWAPAKTEEKFVKIYKKLIAVNR